MLPKDITVKSVDETVTETESKYRTHAQGHRTNFRCYHVYLNTIYIFDRSEFGHTAFAKYADILRSLRGIHATRQPFRGHCGNDGSQFYKPRFSGASIILKFPIIIVIVYDI